MSSVSCPDAHARTLCRHHLNSALTNLNVLLFARPDGLNPQPPSLNSQPNPPQPTSAWAFLSLRYPLPEPLTFPGPA